MRGLGGVLKVIALLLFVGVVQTRLTQLSVPLALLDPLMVVTGILALRLPFVPAIFTGAFAAVVQDSLAGGLVGLHAFSKTLVAAALASLGKVLVVRSEVASALVIGVAAIIEGAVARALLVFLGWPGSEAPGWVLGRGLGTILLAVIVLVIVPQMAARWRRRRGRPRRARIR